MRYVEALEVYEPAPGDLPAIFVAGGIRGCEDWQSRYCKMFEDTSLILLNPRRKSYVWDDAERVRQITWELEHLRKATVVSFWFSPETLNPITLFELGAWSMSRRPIYVGCHPEYEKKSTVETQLQLLRPGLVVVDSLERLAAVVRGALLGEGLKQKKTRELSEVAARMRPILEAHAQHYNFDMGTFLDIVSSAEFAPPEGMHLWWGEMTDWLEDSLPAHNDDEALAWVRELVAIFNGEA
jgi:hypothetical protein